MTDHEKSRDYMLKQQEYSIMYQDGDWVIGDLNEKVKYPGHPLIAHFCKGCWNYVFSSEYARKSFAGSVLHKCSACEETAPDDIITIQTLALK